MLAFYVLDLETNGLMIKNGYHEICELSILRCSDRVQMTRKIKLDNKEHSSLDAMRITNKTMEDYSKGIGKRQLIDDVENFLAEDGLTSANRVLIGHNVISFDKVALWHLWERSNKKFPCDLYLDTLIMSKAAAKTRQLVKPKLNLNAACEIWGVKKVEGAHNAKSDTQNCYLLWDKLMQEMDYLDHIERIPHNSNEDDE